MLSKRRYLVKLLDSTDSLGGKIFAAAVQVLILLSLITFSVDTLPDLSANVRDVLGYIEAITVGIFTVEYLLRLMVAERKLRFVFSFYGVIDLAAILPFYIASGLDLRTLRVFRLFRLFRILKLFKYNQAIKRFHRAIIIAKEELILFGFVALILLYLSSVGIYFFENKAQPEQFSSIFHCLWWSLITLTTVGYGDMYPITSGGKLFTFLILTIGLGIVAVPTGLVASALSQARKENQVVKK